MNTAAINNIESIVGTVIPSRSKLLLVLVIVFVGDYNQGIVKISSFTRLIFFLNKVC